MDNQEPQDSGLDFGMSYESVEDSRFEGVRPEGVIDEFRNGKEIVPLITHATDLKAAALAKLMGKLIEGDLGRSISRMIYQEPAKKSEVPTSEIHFSLLGLASFYSFDSRTGVTGGSTGRLPTFFAAPFEGLVDSRNYPRNRLARLNSAREERGSLLYAQFEKDGGLVPPILIDQKLRIVAATDGSLPRRELLGYVDFLRQAYSFNELSTGAFDFEVEIPNRLSTEKNVVLFIPEQDYEKYDDCVVKVCDAVSNFDVHFDKELLPPQIEILRGLRRFMNIPTKLSEARKKAYTDVVFYPDRLSGDIVVRWASLPENYKRCFKGTDINLSALPRRNDRSEVGEEKYYGVKPEKRVPLGVEMPPDELIARASSVLDSVINTTNENCNIIGASAVTNKLINSVVGNLDEFTRVIRIQVPDVPVSLDSFENGPSEQLNHIRDGICESIVESGQSPYSEIFNFIEESVEKDDKRILLVFEGVDRIVRPWEVAGLFNLIRALREARARNQALNQVRTLITSEYPISQLNLDLFSSPYTEAKNLEISDKEVQLR